MEDTLGITKLSRIKEVIEAAERHNPDVEDMDISFEYFMASCYPTIYQNVLDKLKAEHTKGYINGVADSKDLTIEEIYDKINLEVSKND